jgi:succinyl-diaminopimelate desuccinylase
MAPAASADILTETLELAKRLIACRSVTPADGGALDLIVERLYNAGFACERLDRGQVRNLWARRGTAPPLVCLAGHVDVVPPGPLHQWTSDPFEAVERDGYLFGRGAADMKVAVAALVTAAERFAAAHPTPAGSLALLFTSDEEGDAVDGTRAVVDALRARDESIDFCILGEPTSTVLLGDGIKNGRRGSLHGVLTVRGAQCHIAYPEQGRNPIHEAAPAIAELVAAEWDKGTENFSPTSFQISNVRAGTGATNVIPGALEVVFNFRFSPDSPADRLQAGVHRILDRHGLLYDLTWTSASEPFMYPRARLAAELSAAIRTTTGTTPTLSTSGGTSDGRFLSAICHDLVEFGPVNESIHAIDERVRIADIAPLSQIYERVLGGVLG